VGEQQARVLGSYWARAKVAFDEVYTGTLVRQRRTAEICAEAYREAGGSAWPELQLVPGWNEYDADGILRRLAPAFTAQNETFRAMKAEFDAKKDLPERNRYFQRMFEMVMLEWLEGRLTAEGVEPFAAYQARVRGALAGIRAGPNNRSVAVFTSGGPIGLCVQQALQAPNRAFLDVNWRVRNGSLTEFVFSRDRLSLDSFNNVAHLAEAGLVTFR
jgi:broad specificity phosphatase PhoE